MHISFLKLHSWEHNLCNTALSAQWHHTFNQTYQKLISCSQHSVIQFQWNTFYRQADLLCPHQQRSMTFIFVGMTADTVGSAVLALSGWSSTCLWVICDAHGTLTLSVHCEVYSVEWTAFICNTLAKYASWKQNVVKTFTKNVLLQQCHVKELLFHVFTERWKSSELEVQWRT
jgi:hypothetical protein